MQIQPSTRSVRLLSMYATNADYAEAFGPVKLLPLYDTIPATCPKCDARLIPRLSLVDEESSEPVCLFCGTVFLRPARIVPERPRKVKPPVPKQMKYAHHEKVTHICQTCHQGWQSMPSEKRTNCPSCIARRKAEMVALKAKVLELAATGLSLMKILEHVDVSETTAYGWIVEGRKK